MKNIRESSFWEIEMFNAWDSLEGDRGWRLFVQTFAIFIGGMIGMFAIGMPFDLVVQAYEEVAVITGIALGAVTGFYSIRAGRIYKGHGLPRPNRGYPYDYRYDFPKRAREYFSLPKEDRAMYPNNIIEVMRDPDLTGSQRSTLDTQLRLTYDAIQQRNRERRLMEKRQVDIDGLVQYMQEQREHTQIETDTYREFN